MIKSLGPVVLFAIVLYFGSRGPAPEPVDVSTNPIDVALADQAEHCPKAVSFRAYAERHRGEEAAAARRYANEHDTSCKNARARLRKLAK